MVICGRRGMRKPCMHSQSIYMNIKLRMFICGNYFRVKKIRFETIYNEWR